MKNLSILINEYSSNPDAYLISNRLNALHRDCDRTIVCVILRNLIDNVDIEYTSETMIIIERHLNNMLNTFATDDIIDIATITYGDMFLAFDEFMADDKAV